MNDKLKNLEKELPRNCCSFCTHLSFKGPGADYKYDIKCIILDKMPDSNLSCEHFEAEFTKLNNNDLDDLYINFLDACLRVNYKDYLNSIYWQLFKEKVLSESNYRCSICGSDENIDVYHIRKNLGRESINDVIITCSKCSPE